MTLQKGENSNIIPQDCRASLAMTLQKGDSPPFLFMRLPRLYEQHKGFPLFLSMTTQFDSFLIN
jgi:hypothetical protein